MASRLATRNPQERQRRRQASAQAFPAQTFRAASPWLGYVPDLDPALLGPNAAGVIENLIARPTGRESHEILTHTDGFQGVDSARLPGVVGAGAGSVHANSELAVTMLGFFPRTDAAGARSSDSDLTVMMMTAGDASAAGSAQLWRLRPSNGQWQVIAHAGSGTAAAQGLPLSTDKDLVLGDWCVFAPGSPNRTIGAITVPAFVFTNNQDEVYVYPDATAGTNYEALTAFGTTFLARSVCTFAGRVNFLNTVETGVRYRQRLRRAHIGEADPNTSIGTGSGALDLREFAEDGLKLANLGDVMAAYFGDGVAFIRATGNPVAPYQRQILTTQRGLLSTHSVCAIDGNTHYGLFTDGWWILDSSGRWTEVGITEIEGIQVTKWKSTFYDRIDLNLRERIFVHYDESRRLVYITIPIEGSGGADPNQEVWIWDPRGDRVWIDTYHATCFVSANKQVRAGITIGDLETYVDSDTTIGELGSDTIGSFGPQYSVRETLHGTYTGMVMQHELDTTARANVDTLTTEEPSYRYQSVLSPVGSPRSLKLGQRLQLEIERTAGMSAPSLGFFCNASQASDIGSVDPTVIPVGDVNILWRWARFLSPQLGFEVSGVGPVRIHSVEADVSDTGTEVRR